jgi:hypothetical protein
MKKYTDGGVNYQKKWRVVYITMQGKRGTKELILGRLSDKQDVMNALRRMPDINIREVIAIQELKEYGGYMAKGGGTDGGKLKNGKYKYEKGDEGMFQGYEVRVVKYNTGNGGFYDYNIIDEENGKVINHGVAKAEKFENQFAYFPKPKGGYMAKGGETSDSEYRKRMKQFGFKPYGNTKGNYKIEFIEDGKKQSEIWESKEMAEDREKKLLKIGNTNIKITKLPSMKMGGKVTFDDKVSSIKKSLLKTKKVSPKVQKDYGKTYNKKEALESAKRIAGAMKAKYKK